MAAETKRTKTAYNVLKKTGGETLGTKPAFELVGNNLEAHNSSSAIRTYVDRAGKDANGTYVAVPARSFEEVTVTVETTTVVKLGTG